MKKFLMLSLLMASTVGLAQEKPADNIFIVKAKEAKSSVVSFKNSVQNNIAKAITAIRNAKVEDVKSFVTSKEFAIGAGITAAAAVTYLAVKKCTYIRKKLGLHTEKKARNDVFLV